MKQQNQKGFGIVLLLDILFVVGGIILLIYIISKNWESFQSSVDSLKSIF